MRTLWLHRGGNDSVILFFNGWGMSEQVVGHLDCLGYDVLVVYDYRDTETPAPDLSAYSAHYLVAWSTGVMMSGLWCIPWARAVAFNGTGHTVDNAFGIPERIFGVTIRSFSGTTCKKFLESAGLPGYWCRSECRDSPSVPEPSVAGLGEELLAIRDRVPPPPVSFDKVFVSRADRIIPPSNQRAWWERQGIVPQILAGGHYPFGGFSSWSEVLYA